MTKAWYFSKTKLGGLFLGLGIIFSGIGGLLTGKIDSYTSIEQIVLGISSILIVTGIRDAINKE